MNLNDKAVLVQLTIRQWTARRFDKKATREVASQHAVSEFVGRYNKNLLPGQDLLKQVSQLASTIRQEFYDNTLPWGIEGTYILPTRNYLSFMSTFRSRKTDWEKVANQFTTEYPNLKAMAQRHLGSLYNEADYPTPQDIARRFSMDMAVLPVPSEDFRCEIHADELLRIQQDVQQRVQQASQQAMREVWQRLYDRVQHIAEKLNDPKAIFRDSMVENARELCDLLPRLNFAEDPHLERMRQQVERTLINKHPDTLRSDPLVRRETADEARNILDAMDIYMGGMQ